MDTKKFRDLEGLYKDLKERQEAGEVSAEEMKAELKKMMIRDEDNRYWMLGGKTGSWYVYDGSAWTPGDPYPAQESPAVPTVVHPEPPAAHKKESTPFVGEVKGRSEHVFAAEKEVEDKPEMLCRFCHSRLEEHDSYCKFCGGSQKGPDKPAPRQFTGDEIQFRAVRLVSLAIFLGGLGLVLGVVLGASFGIFKIFGDLIYQFPVMLQEMRGKLLGGLFFGALGGIAGFIAFALVGLVLGLFFNALCFVFTGPRFKVRS